MGTVTPITHARKLRMAARVQRAPVNSGDCGCGCGEQVEVDERIAYDRKRGVAYRLEHWLKLEGLES
jgi:hypothetical protein